jgi:class 3 adenylate cyclase
MADPPAHDAAVLEEENQRLRRALGELTILNELAVSLGRSRDLDAAVRTLVRRSIKALGAEQGVVTLTKAGEDEGPHTLVRTGVGRGPALRPDEALLGWMERNRGPLVLNDPRAHPIFGAFTWDAAVRSALCVPLVVRGRLVGVLTLYNKRDGGTFEDPDARLLTIIAAQSAQIVDAARAEAERVRVLNVFGRHTAPAVVEELLRHGADPPSRRTEACVMFLDIRGFTTYAERATPEEVVGYLNSLFDFMIEEVTSRGGIIHQLLGDGFMAFFGAPVAHGDECERAVAASLAIAERLPAVCAEKGLPETRVGIGLHVGQVVAGTVGSHLHKEYKITGDPVNVAARIESMNKEFDSQVLASEAVWSCLPDGQFEAESLGPVPVRGREKTLGLYRLA